MKDTQKRAIYDDEQKLKNNQAWIFKIGKFKINILYFFSIALLAYLISLKIDKIKEILNFYYCPIGNEKYSIASIKLNKQNLKLLNIIEVDKLNDKDLTRIAEDDEYEYYVKKV